MAAEQAIEIDAGLVQLSDEGLRALGHLELVQNVEVDTDSEFTPEAVRARNDARNQAYEARLNEVADRPGMAATVAFLRWAHQNNLAGYGPIAVAKS
jgi:hypothetical protein